MIIRCAISFSPELIPPLLGLIDERKIAFDPDHELSFLTKCTGHAHRRNGQLSIHAQAQL